MTPDSPALARSGYTPWIRRVLAWILDAIPALVLVAIGVTMLMTTRETACSAVTSEYEIGPYCSTGASPAGQVSVLAGIVLALLYQLWNHGYRQGTTGASLGKSALGFRVVRERDGRPVGFVLSIVRQVAHLVDAILCYVGFLFPLWDAKRQTIADKIMSTVCVPSR